MRFIAPLLFAAATMIALSPDIGAAQGDLPQPPIPFKPPPPPPPAPVKPYKPVTVTPAGTFSDPSFAAFRKTLAGAAQRKDRAALAKLVVGQGFFWVQEKDLADKSKAGIDNLAKAIGLDNPQAGGWEILANDAEDPTLAQLPRNPGLYCAPAPPTFDLQAFAALVAQTETEPTDWGYPADNGTEVRAAPRANAPVVGKLGMYFVRVLPDSAASSFVHVALPEGKTGFVALDDLSPLANDQICYTKEEGGWKIVGYIGGVSP